MTLLNIFCIDMNNNCWWDIWDEFNLGLKVARISLKLRILVSSCDNMFSSSTCGRYQVISIEPSVNILLNCFSPCGQSRLKNVSCLFSDKISLIKVDLPSKPDEWNSFCPEFSRVFCAVFPLQLGGSQRPRGKSEAVFLHTLKKERDCKLCHEHFLQQPLFKHEVTGFISNHEYVLRA